MRKILLQSFLFLLLSCITLWAAYNGYRLYQGSKEKNILKSEYADINDIKCGLFNVEIWSTHAYHILSAKISEFSLGQGNRKMLKKEVENVLYTLLNEAEKALNEKKKGVARLKQAVINAFVDMEEYKKKVPHFAEVIMKEIEKSLNKEEMKNMIKDKLNEYASEVSYDDAYTAAQKKILEKYHLQSVEACNQLLMQKSSVLDAACQHYGMNILYPMLIIIAGWLLIYRFPAVHGVYFIFSVLIALICLLCGITSPMIEIDARIGELHFTLLNETISFRDQVIFYRSKSILDVVKILTSTGKPDSTIVGIMIIFFSIVFPIVKIICVILMAWFKRFRNSKFIHFMVFKSGKWSMADVLVVAIFMAYIGFNGILNDQLEYINFNTESLSIITTNKTALEIGFSLFVAFCVFNLVISEILKRVMWKQEQLRL